MDYNYKTIIDNKHLRLQLKKKIKRKGISQQILPLKKIGMNLGMNWKKSLLTKPSYLGLWEK